MRASISFVHLVCRAVVLMLVVLMATATYAQITPSDDSYVNSGAPTVNYGTAITLSVSSAANTTFIRFDLTPVPAGYTGASIAKATLKLYVNTVVTAGSFNVDYVTGTWAEKTITYGTEPTIGATIVSSVPLTTASKGTYVEIDITPAMVEWLNGTQPNDGIALAANSPLVTTFDSKENTAASHPPELDVVFAGGTLTGVTTASGSGLTGGGTSGTLNLGLANTCAANQVLQWNGSAWVCAAVGTGTITGVTAGTDLTGGGTSGNVTLNLNTANVPQLNAANTFTGNQTVIGNLSTTGGLSANGSLYAYGGLSSNGSLSVLGSVNGSAFTIGGSLFAFGSPLTSNAFLGFAGNTTTTGNFNTATGLGASYSNTSGAYNTADGYWALHFNNAGGYNTADGYGALLYNAGGIQNTADGFYALVSNTAGNYNTAVGLDALANNTTGSYNTALGIYAGPGGSSPNLTNATAVGASAQVTQSNSLVLGSISGINGATASVKVGIGTTTPASTLDVQGGVVHIVGSTSSYPTQGAFLGWNMSGGQGETDFVNNEGLGGGGWYFVNTNSSGGYKGWSAFLDSSGNLHSSSSRRWKTNIHTLHGALAKIGQLRGVSYDRKDSGKHEIGVIAEEVGEVVPEVVSWEKNGTDALGVDYARLTALLIEATKEQQALLHAQQEQIGAQQAQIVRLTRQVKTIQATLKTNGSNRSVIRTVKANSTTVGQ